MPSLKISTKVQNFPLFNDEWCNKATVTLVITISSLLAVLAVPRVRFFKQLKMCVCRLFSMAATLVR